MDTSENEDQYKTLMIDNNPVKKVKYTKFLGVTIDEDLNWNQHITDLKRKLYHSLSTINRIKHCIPETLIKDLYYTLIKFEVKRSSDSCNSHLPG